MPVTRATLMAARATVFENLAAAETSPADAGSGGGVTVYANTDTLPLSGVDNGSLAHVTSTNRLYIWTGTGWYNIALINQTPTIQANSYSSSYTLDNTGANTVIELVASDPEEIPITWSYTTTLTGNTATISQSNNTFTITPSTDSADAGSFSITFKASDGVNIGTATSSFTLAFVSPYWKDVALLTGTNDTNGLQNNSFVDRSTNGYTITSAGDPTQSAFHPYLDNYSVYFDGSGDWLRDDTIGDEIQTAFDDTGVTIDFWVYPEFSAADSTPAVIGSNSSTAGNEFIVGADTITIYSSGSFTTHSYSSGMNRYQWNHCAIQFDLNDSRRISVWINGSRVLNLTATGWFDISNNSFGFGAESDSGYWGSLGNYWKGYIFDMRMTTGPVYGNVDNITVPTAVQETLADTFIHIFKSNNWSTDRTYSVGGTPKTTAYIPFGQSSVYTPGENKGSVLLNGSTDYLLPGITTAIGTNDFTLEGWFYFEDVTSDTTFFDLRTSGNWGIFSFLGSNQAVAYYNGSTSVGQTTNTVTANEWNHIAIVRESGSVKIYINGVLGSTTSDTTSYTIASSSRIGANQGNINYVDGYISDVRLVNGTAVYTSNFTPPSSPVGNTNASLYLPMDNAGIVDQSGNQILTLVGDVQTSTTQTKYATTSMYFDGTGDYIDTNNNLHGNFGTGNFTVEAWVYLNESIGTNRAIFGSGTSDSNDEFTLLLLSTGEFYFDWGGASAYIQQSGATFTANAWHHVAITRSGTQLDVWLDGTSVVSNSSHSFNYTGTSTFKIGMARNGAFVWNGYIEDVQIIKGQAKYTSNFTPPTASLSQSIQ